MTGEGEAARLVRAADALVVLTGAGVSAESGVPTFRSEGGLWKEHRPEDLATPGAFARDPRLVWEWYESRREKVSRCEPNAGHLAIARCQSRGDGVRVVTQNVDGLHHRALDAVRGRTSEDGADGVAPAEAEVLELHGSLFRVRCSGCGWRDRRLEPIDATTVETLPRCPGCGGLLRPDVVWFGESLDPAILEAAFDAARSADVCLVVGTSAVVHPAASIPLATLRGGGALIEVNPERTELSGLATVSLRGPAGEVLPPLLGSA